MKRGTGVGQRIAMRLLVTLTYTSLSAVAHPHVLVSHINVGVPAGKAMPASFCGATANSPKMAAMIVRYIVPHDEHYISVLPVGDVRVPNIQVC